MSLVLEALRRVEKTDARTGSIGATVPSYRPRRRKTGSALPLILGLGTGGLAVVFFGPQLRGVPDIAPVASAERQDEPMQSALRAKGRAGLPPPLVAPENSGGRLAPGSSSRGASFSVAGGSPRPAAVAEPPAVPALVLQAISERDSRPIAIINDRLVSEGDVVGTARVVRIGSDTVEVRLENGKTEIVRFAAPPEPTPTPTPL